MIKWLWKIGLQITVITLLLSGCALALVVFGFIRDSGQENILSNARNVEEASKILNEIFNPGVSTVSDIESYHKNASWNCTEYQHHSDGDNDRIVCWLPVSRPEGWDKLDWVSKLVTRYTFRVVFWFKNETLNTIEIVLDDVSL